MNLLPSRMLERYVTNVTFLNIFTRKISVPFIAFFHVYLTTKPPNNET